MSYANTTIGLREIDITPIDPDTLALGTPIPLPGSQVLTFKRKQDKKSLRGNDRTIDTSIQNIAADWSFDHGGLIPLDAAEVLSGGTLEVSGTSPNEVKTLTQRSTDQPGFFRIRGRSVNSKGVSGSKIVYYYCQCETFEGEMKDGEYWVSKAGGEAIGHPSNDKVWDLVQEETSVALA